MEALEVRVPIAEMLTVAPCGVKPEADQVGFCSVTLRVARAQLRIPKRLRDQSRSCLRAISARQIKDIPSSPDMEDFACWVCQKIPEGVNDAFHMRLHVNQHLNMCGKSPCGDSVLAEGKLAEKEVPQRQEDGREDCTTDTCATMLEGQSNDEAGKGGKEQMKEAVTDEEIGDINDYHRDVMWSNTEEEHLRQQKEAAPELIPEQVDFTVLEDSMLDQDRDQEMETMPEEAQAIALNNAEVGLVSLYKHLDGEKDVEVVTLDKEEEVVILSDEGDEEGILDAVDVEDEEDEEVEEISRPPLVYEALDRREVIQCLPLIFYIF